MNKIIKANMHANWLFYRRNRLLLIIGILMLALFAITMIPSIMFTSSNERFNIVMQIYGSMAGFTQVILIVIALISVWYHRSNKCIKLIFTKNCTPELWIGSHYLTAACVLAAGLLLAVAAYIILSLAWSMPVQAGVGLVTVYTFLSGMIAYVYLILLTTWMHPVVALVVYFALSDGLVYWLGILCSAGVEHFESGFSHLLLGLLKYIFEGLYYILPTMSPMSHELEKLQTSMRVTEGSFSAILLAGGYLVIFGLFCYLLTCLSLRRQRMN